MMQQLDAIACQTNAHRDRFIALGASPHKVTVTGSVKFDVSLPDDFDTRVTELKSRFGLDDSSRVWIAASTHPGEDEVVLAAHLVLREQLPGARLVLVPRHPVRCDDVAKLVSDAGLSLVRQSAQDNDEEDNDGGHSDGDAQAEVILGDTMGTLQILYGLAQVAYVGGSLVDVGGHNPIEPAICDVPVVCGPFQYNFTEIMQTMSQRGGLHTITGAEDLARTLVDWLTHEEARADAAAAARAVVELNRGAQEKIRALVSERIDLATGQGD